MERSETMSLTPICEGSQLLCTAQGNILFGCPPEILKFILLKELPMPETVILPSKLHYQSCSQVALEFPFYHFLFVQRGPDRGRKFRVLAQPSQCQLISELLRVTVYGPTKSEMLKAGTEPEVATQLDKELSHLAVKNPNANQPYKLTDIVEFSPIEKGKKQVLYAEKNSSPAVYIEQVAEAVYKISHGGKDITVDISITSEQVPPYPLKHEKVIKSPSACEVIILGGSNGFDPNNPANGYLFHVKEQLLLWDSPSYLSQHLKALGLTLDDIDAMILSHVHEDHLDVVECVDLQKPLKLYATREVYYSLLVKLMAVYGCSLEEAQAMHSYIPITPNLTPQSICGAECSFFHSIHPIPAIGMRMEVNNNGKKALLHLTGDHVSNDVLEKINSAGVLSAERYSMFKQFPNGQEQLVLVDAGGGLIHGDYRDYINLSNKIAFMHTHLISGSLPENKLLVQSGQRITIA